MAKRGRKPFSSFYHTRWNRVGLNVDKAARIIGTTPEQIVECDIHGAPIYVEKFLLLWDNKRIGHEGWQG